MDDELLKLECLKLSDGDIEAAKKQYDWIKGRNQGDGIKPIDPKTPQARVVGKDNNFEPPFDDYVKK